MFRSCFSDQIFIKSLIKSLKSDQSDTGEAVACNTFRDV